MGVTPSHCDKMHTNHIHHRHQAHDSQGKPTKTNEDQWGPTAASVDVQGWAQVCFFFFIHSFSIDIWYSNIIFIGPIQANGGQWQLTTTNVGQQQPKQANKYHWKPTVASTGQQIGMGQMMWHVNWTQVCFYCFLFIYLPMIFYIIGQCRPTNTNAYKWKPTAANVSQQMVTGMGLNDAACHLCPVCFHFFSSFIYYWYTIY